MPLIESVLYALLTAFYAGAFRNVLGYLKTSLEDGKLDTYEVNMLGAKFAEALLLTVALTLGGATQEQAVAGSVLVSYARSAIESKK